MSMPWLSRFGAIARQISGIILTLTTVTTLASCQTTRADSLVNDAIPVQSNGADLNEMNDPTAPSESNLVHSSPLPFDHATNFSDGVALVRQGDRLSLITVDGTTAIALDPAIDNLAAFSDQRALAKVGEQYGYIDAAGAWVIDPQYAAATPFQAGLAAVQRQKYGFIDPQGNVVIALQYDWAAGFSDGLAAVKLGTIYGYVTPMGDRLMLPTVTDAWSFAEARAVARGLDDTWGYLDKTGDWAIAPQFDGAFDFAEQRGRVRQGSQWGFIDPAGTMVIAPQYSFALDFADGLAGVQLNQKWGFIDATGTVQIPPQFDYVQSFSGDRAAVLINGKYGFIDRTGTVVIAPEYDRVGTFQSGWAWVQTGDRWGYIDPIGTPWRGQHLQP